MEVPPPLLPPPLLPPPLLPPPLLLLPPPLELSAADGAAATGEIGDEVEEEELVPIEFVAVTENVYEVPLDKFE